MESEIKMVLTALLSGMGRVNGGLVLPQVAKLDDLVAQGRASLHPQLVHFLERRSYAKALMFLEGEQNIPAGICGGRAGRTEG